MAVDVSALNRKFGIAGVAEVVAANGGLPAVRVRGKNGSGEIYLHGGHVTSWTPAGGRDALWCSKKSMYEKDKPIRGGVPLCFPWFGPKADDASAPPHGIARLMAWELESIREQGGDVTVVVALRSDASTKKWWPHDFVLRHRVTYGRELLMQMELTNSGNAPLTVQEAQHTYFAVGDARQIVIRGLAGVTYRSKVENVTAAKQEGDIRITAETDRVYLDTQSAVIIEDPSYKRRIAIHKENSKTTVVWNPWIAKAKAMPDFGDDEWPEMVCVETCNVGDFAVQLKAGETHIMGTRLKVESL